MSSVLLMLVLSVFISTFMPPEGLNSARCNALQSMTSSVKV